jgi:hypothetical protein
VSRSFSLCAAASLLAAAFYVSTAAAAQAPRPSPMIFSGGACHDQACSLERWRAFLRKQGEVELPTTGSRLRYFELTPEEKDVLDACGLYIEREDLETGATSWSACTISGKSVRKPEQLALLKAVLAAPDLAKLDGPFPSYCQEGDAGDEKTSLLEIVQDGRYRLIEWDCEVPPPVIPLLQVLKPNR